MKKIIWVSALLAVCHGAAAHAQFTNARVQIDQEDEFGNVGAPLSTNSGPTSAATGTPILGYAVAGTSYGRNEAFAQATMQPAGRWHIAASTWSDRFTVTGGAGVLNMSVELDGAFMGSFLGDMPQSVGVDWLYALVKSPAPLGGADFMWDYLSEDTAFGPDGRLVAPAGSTLVFNSMGSAGDDMGTYLAPVAFSQNEEFYLTSFLNVDAVSDGMVDFSASFGITAPPGAMLTSLSNADYAAAAVPEPETWALLLAGLGLLGFAARKKKFVALASFGSVA